MLTLSGCCCWLKVRVTKIQICITFALKFCVKFVLVKIMNMFSTLLNGTCWLNLFGMQIIHHLNSSNGFIKVKVTDFEIYITMTFLFCNKYILCFLIFIKSLNGVTVQFICPSISVFVSTLKAPNKNCGRRHFNFSLLSFEENEAWLFMWIHLKHQVSFSLKNNEKIFMNAVCCSCDWRFKG